MRVLVDESVSCRVAIRLRRAGYSVRAVAEDASGTADADVFETAVRDGAVLVTRDHHFTNPIRYDSARCAGIVYIRHGNYTSDEEAELVERFLATWREDDLAGRLVVLYREGLRVR